MRKMNVHEGLATIKLYDKKIKKAIENAKFITYGKEKSKVLENTENKIDFKDKAKATYTSIVDMIKERAKIKSAIIISNAKTSITVAGETMTVAEAIELKDSITLRELLRDELAEQANIANDIVIRKNSSVDDKAIKLVEGLELEGEQKMEQINSYIENNKYEVVTFDKKDKEFDDLNNFIEDFLYEVDFSLSTSNAITMIEI